MSLPASHHRADAYADAPTIPRPRTELRLATTPPRRRIARGVAGYAGGMAAGFVVLAGASVPAGPAVVAGQAKLAFVAAVVAGLAAVAARARRRGGREPVSGPQSGEPAGRQPTVRVNVRLPSMRR